MATLDEVLSGKEEVVEPETTEVEAEAPEPEEVEAVEEETEEVAEEPAEPKGVEKTEPPSVTKEVPLTALLDERDKRKQLQAEIEAMRKANEEKKESPDFWENPQQAVESMLNSKVEELNAKYTNGYLSLSMQYSKAFHNDFDDAKQAFIRAAEQNPALADAALKAEMPGEFIYKAGKEYLMLDQAGGDLESAIERAKREAVEEYIAKNKPKSKVAAIPKALTEETSASAPREKVEGGETPLENIFVHNRG